ncbi:MAG: glycosyltransferase family 2 protein [Dolichospermum sp. DET73]|jgi:hypothetical protein|nr:glycosyltransferase family 2 protein [Dolichospermum sp. DET73]
MINSPVLTFIIPLKSPEVSKDWSVVSQLCCRTLQSILKQSCPELKIILVCNCPPDNYPKDSRLEIVVDTFSIPQNYSEIFLDQKLKIKRGMIACKGFSQGYVMRMDADDFIHSELVAFVKQNFGKNGWYFPQGYVYQKGSRWIYLRNNFHFSTASSHIIWLTEEDLPDSMDTPDTDYFVDLWQHLRLKETCDNLSRLLEPMPFRAAAYTIGHSESVMLHSLASWSSLRQMVWKAVSIRPLTQKHIKDFGF